MSLDWFLLGLRLVATLILYTFLGVAFYIIWRELKQTEVVVETRRSDQLRVVAVDEDQPFVVGQTLPLQPLTVVGIDDQHKIIISYEALSAWQIRFRRKNDGWWLERAAEANGATLNGSGLPEATPLIDGDLIEVSHICFRVEMMSREG